MLVTLEDSLKVILTQKWLQYEELSNMENITLGQIALALGTITVIWTFYTKVIKTIEDSLDKKFDPLKKDIKLCLTSEVLLMHHLTEGNHTEKIEQLIKDIEKELISK